MIRLIAIGVAIAIACALYKRWDEKTDVLTPSPADSLTSNAVRTARSATRETHKRIVTPASEPSTGASFQSRNIQQEKNAEIPVNGNLKSRPVNPSQNTLASTEENREFSLLLEQTDQPIQDFGYSKEKMVNDFQSGIRCKQQDGRLGFYMDLQSNITILFDWNRETYIYDFPQRIIKETSNDQEMRFQSASRRNDLKKYYTFEVFTNDGHKGLGTLRLSSDYPPKSSGHTIPFVCE